MDLSSGQKHYHAESEFQRSSARINNTYYHISFQGDNDYLLDQNSGTNIDGSEGRYTRLLKHLINSQAIPQQDVLEKKVFEHENCMSDDLSTVKRSGPRKSCEGGQIKITHFDDTVQYLKPSCDVNLLTEVKNSVHEISWNLENRCADPVKKFSTSKSNSDKSTENSDNVFSEPTLYHTQSCNSVSHIHLESHRGSPSKSKTSDSSTLQNCHSNLPGSATSSKLLCEKDNCPTSDNFPVSQSDHLDFDKAQVSHQINKESKRSIRVSLFQNSQMVGSSDSCSPYEISSSPETDHCISSDKDMKSNVQSRAASASRENFYGNCLDFSENACQYDRAIPEHGKFASPRKCTPEINKASVISPATDSNSYLTQTKWQSQNAPTKHGQKTDFKSNGDSSEYIAHCVSSKLDTKTTPNSYNQSLSHQKNMQERQGLCYTHDQNFKKNRTASNTLLLEVRNSLKPTSISRPDNVFQKPDTAGIDRIGKRGFVLKNEAVDEQIKSNSLSLKVNYMNNSAKHKANRRRYDGQHEPKRLDLNQVKCSDRNRGNLQIDSDDLADLVRDKIYFLGKKKFDSMDWTSDNGETDSDTEKSYLISRKQCNFQDSSNKEIYDYSSESLLREGKQINSDDTDIAFETSDSENCSQEIELNDNSQETADFIGSTKPNVTSKSYLYTYKEIKKELLRESGISMDEQGESCGSTVASNSPFIRTIKQDVSDHNPRIKRTMSDEIFIKNFSTGQMHYNFENNPAEQCAKPTAGCNSSHVASHTSSPFVRTVKNDKTSQSSVTDAWRPSSGRPVSPTSDSIIVAAANCSWRKIRPNAVAFRQLRRNQRSRFGSDPVQTLIAKFVNQSKMYSDSQPRRTPASNLITSTSESLDGVTSERRLDSNRKANFELTEQALKAHTIATSPFRHVLKRVQTLDKWFGQLQEEQMSDTMSVSDSGSSAHSYHSDSIMMIKKRNVVRLTSADTLQREGAISPDTALRAEKLRAWKERNLTKCRRKTPSALELLFHRNGEKPCDSGPDEKLVNKSVTSSRTKGDKTINADHTSVSLTMRNSEQSFSKHRSNIRTPERRREVHNSAPEQVERGSILTSTNENNRLKNSDSEFNETAENGEGGKDKQQFDVKHSEMLQGCGNAEIAFYEHVSPDASSRKVKHDTMLKSQVNAQGTTTKHSPGSFIGSASEILERVRNLQLKFNFKQNGTDVDNNGAGTISVESQLRSRNFDEYEQCSVKTRLRTADLHTDQQKASEISQSEDLFRTLESESTSTEAKNFNNFKETSSLSSKKVDDNYLSKTVQERRVPDSHVPHRLNSEENQPKKTAVLLDVENLKPTSDSKISALSGNDALHLSEIATEECTPVEGGIAGKVFRNDGLWLLNDREKKATIACDSIVDVIEEEAVCLIENTIEPTTDEIEMAKSVNTLKQQFEKCGISKQKLELDADVLKLKNEILDGNTEKPTENSSHLKVNDGGIIKRPKSPNLDKFKSLKTMFEAGSSESQSSDSDNWKALSKNLKKSQKVTAFIEQLDTTGKEQENIESSSESTLKKKQGSIEDISNSATEVHLNDASKESKLEANESAASSPGTQTSKELQSENRAIFVTEEHREEHIGKQETAAPVFKANVCFKSSKELGTSPTITKKRKEPFTTSSGDHEIEDSITRLNDSRSGLKSVSDTGKSLITNQEEAEPRGLSSENVTEKKVKTPSVKRKPGHIKPLEQTVPDSDKTNQENKAKVDSKIPTSMKRKQSLNQCEGLHADSIANKEQGQVTTSREHKTKEKTSNHVKRKPSFKQLEEFKMAAGTKKEGKEKDIDSAEHEIKGKTTPSVKRKPSFKRPAETPDVGSITKDPKKSTTPASKRKHSFQRQEETRSPDFDNEVIETKKTDFNKLSEEDEGNLSKIPPLVKKRPSFKTLEDCKPFVLRSRNLEEGEVVNSRQPPDDISENKKFESTAIKVKKFETVDPKINKPSPVSLPNSCNNGKDLIVKDIDTNGLKRSKFGNAKQKNGKTVEVVSQNTCKSPKGSLRDSLLSDGNGTDESIAQKIPPPVKRKPSFKRPNEKGDTSETARSVSDTSSSIDAGLKEVPDLLSNTIKRDVIKAEYQVEDQLKTQKTDSKFNDYIDAVRSDNLNENKETDKTGTIQTGGTISKLKETLNVSNKTFKECQRDKNKTVEQSVSKSSNEPALKMSNSELGSPEKTDSSVLDEVAENLDCSHKSESTLPDIQSLKKIFSAEELEKNKSKLSSRAKESTDEFVSDGNSPSQEVGKIINVPSTTESAGGKNGAKTDLQHEISEPKEGKMLPEDKKVTYERNVEQVDSGISKPRVEIHEQTDTAEDEPEPIVVNVDISEIPEGGNLFGTSSSKDLPGLVSDRSKKSDTAKSVQHDFKQRKDNISSSSGNLKKPESADVGRRGRPEDKNHNLTCPLPDKIDFGRRGSFTERQESYVSYSKMASEIRKDAAKFGIYSDDKEETKGDRSTLTSQSDSELPEKQLVSSDQPSLSIPLSAVPTGVKSDSRSISPNVAMVTPFNHDKMKHYNEEADVKLENQENDGRSIGQVEDEKMAELEIKERVNRDILLEEVSEISVTLTAEGNCKEPRNYSLGNISTKELRKWTEAEDRIHQLLKDHLSLIDEEMLDISQEDIRCVHVGRHQVALGEIPSKSSSKESSCKCNVHLKDSESGSVASLAYDTLLSKRTLQKYVSLVLNHRFLVFYGPSGTSKSHLARGLANVVASRLKENNNLIDPVLLSNVTSEKWKKLLEYLSKSDVVNNPLVLVLDGFSSDFIESNSDVTKLFGELNQSSTYIVATLGQSENIEISCSWQQTFRWVWLPNHEEPISGLLKRFLRKRYLEGMKSESMLNNLLLIADWISTVWKHINSIIEKFHSTEHTVGPAMFFSSPATSDEIEEWFVDLWNYSLAPYFLQTVKRGLKSFGQRCAWDDPLDWILETYPWQHENNLSGKLRRIRKEDVGFKDTDNSSPSKSIEEQERLMNFLRRLETLVGDKASATTHQQVRKAVSNPGTSSTTKRRMYMESTI